MEDGEEKEETVRLAGSYNNSELINQVTIREGHVEKNINEKIDKGYNPGGLIQAVSQDNNSTSSSATETSTGSAQSNDE